ncbi:hypothetical protein HN018_14920 [Lichenicola cladoniae]|uniref:Polysaccharide biosynthesis enzyme WcbI domain-containing protein n=1 Tax=Lichenicola cladoniae TaxID=1484109 RepID=A0A6M8HRR6_9PROT|nr:WcbI family polysaccharide biosynthesis putative acetyltransferase [Lichenicola cladoniae]NPD65828.1 hypothetical protein [Acetobacteraceae bacterium]QKE91164.1 hypothetical protein HN018_14920 [Lichenicola cladoniae]
MEAAGESCRPLILIDANWQAKPLVALLETTRLIADTVEFRHFEQRNALTDFLRSCDATLSQVVAVWQQVTDFWKPELWEPLPGLQSHIAVVRFPLFECPCFWPLAGTDPRNHRAPPFYPDGRYPFSDRICASLADADDRSGLYDRYLEGSIPELDDLDKRLTDQIVSLARRDELCDVPISLFFLNNYRKTKLFHTPSAPAGAFYGWIGARLAERLAVCLGHDPALFGAAVTQHAIGLQGVGQFRYAVHPVVAEQFGLAWAAPNSAFRFGKNLWTHRDAIERAIRWDAWTP